MRVMVIVKGAGGCATSATPDEKFLAEMREYNQALEKAGVMIAVERLRPLAEGARVRFSDAKRTVIDGPFPETKELVGGFWLWEVKSKEEAIEWIKRCPSRSGREAEIEIREVLDPGDFGPALTRK